MALPQDDVVALTTCTRAPGFLRERIAALESQDAYVGTGDFSDALVDSSNTLSGSKGNSKRKSPQSAQTTAVLSTVNNDSDPDCVPQVLDISSIAQLICDYSSSGVRFGHGPLV